MNINYDFRARDQLVKGITEQTITLGGVSVSFAERVR